MKSIKFYLDKCKSVEDNLLKFKLEKKQGKIESMIFRSCLKNQQETTNYHYLQGIFYLGCAMMIFNLYVAFQGVIIPVVVFR